MRWCCHCGRQESHPHDSDWLFSTVSVQMLHWLHLFDFSPLCVWCVLFSMRCNTHYTVCMMCSVWHSPPCEWCVIFSTACMVCGVNHGMYGVWCWCVVCAFLHGMCGVWCVVFSMMCGVWCMVYGVRCRWRHCWMQESPPHVSDPCRPVSHAAHHSHSHNRSRHDDDGDSDEEEDLAKRTPGSMMLLTVMRARRHLHLSKTHHGRSMMIQFKFQFLNQEVVSLIPLLSSGFNRPGTLAAAH